MRVCFFGSYLPEYSRNKILIDGLEKNGVEIYHCRSTVGSFLQRYVELTRQYLRFRNKIDVIFVALVGQLDMPLAWLLARLTGKKVVFDMFYSMYDTYVFDRQSTNEGSLRAVSYWWIDKIAATLADKIITDTNSHALYFQKLFHLAPQKFNRIFVGGDDTEFFPRKVRYIRKKVRVEFHGMFTRLQGAEYFIKAAKMLEHRNDIEFWLIGSSKIFKEPLVLLRKLKLKNLKYFPRMKVEKLARYISMCDISVSHLGNSIKANNVISNKTYQAMLAQTALIVGDTTANREIFINMENSVFVELENYKNVADRIILLAKNQRLRDRLAQNSYKYALNFLTNDILGKQLKGIFDQII